jgi:uncharacterized membrane protein
MIQIILFLHIAAGVAALASAGLAVGSAKGGGIHRVSGKAYTLAMLFVGLSALVMAVVNPNAFLFAIGVFSLYLVFTGWRAATVRDGRPRLVDHAGAAAMTLVGLVMFGWGAQGLLEGGGAQPVILLVFGSIGLTMSFVDWRDWPRGPITGKSRIARHLGRMLGATIATITAAGVVNLDQLPELVVWLGPTAILTPVIFWWTARVMNGTERP